MNKALIYDGHTLKTENWTNDSYEFISTHVGGYIELVPNIVLEKKGIDMWCNEEGKFDSDLEPTMALTCDGKIYDYLVGNLVFTRTDGKGNTTTLTDDDVKYITSLIEKAPFTINYGVVKCLDYEKEVAFEL